MWMLPLYLHVNQKSNYDDDDDMKHSRVGNYHANSPNHAKTELVQEDFMSVPVILS